MHRTRGLVDSPSGHHVLSQFLKNVLSEYEFIRFVEFSEVPDVTFPDGNGHITAVLPDPTRPSDDVSLFPVSARDTIHFSHEFIKTLPAARVPEVYWRHSIIRLR